MRRHASSCRQLLLCLLFFLSFKYFLFHKGLASIHRYINRSSPRKQMPLDNGDIKPLVSHQQERVLSLPSLESVEWQRRETRVSRFVASPGTHDICDLPIFKRDKRLLVVCIQFNHSKGRESFQLSEKVTNPFFLSHKRNHWPLMKYSRFLWGPEIEIVLRKQSYSEFL